MKFTFIYVTSGHGRSISSAERARSRAYAGPGGRTQGLAGRLIRRLREQAYDGDLTMSQKSVVLHLDREGPATVTTLARALDMRPQSMGAIVSALQLAGLVEGAADPADGRQTLLSLTPACRDMIATGRAARQDWLFRAIQSKLDREQQEQLAGAVELLRRLADF